LDLAHPQIDCVQNSVQVSSYDTQTQSTYVTTIPVTYNPMNYAGSRLETNATDPSIQCALKRGQTENNEHNE